MVTAHPTHPEHPEFTRLQRAAAQGVAPLLDDLIGQLREAGRSHELFEALKMRTRWELQLPLLAREGQEDLPEEVRDRLESGLVAACREVGLQLFRQGKIREGWLYLRPVGDRSLVARELAAVAEDGHNTEELVELCLHEGLDVRRGFQLVLDHYGTCNAITTFESSVGRLPHRDQQAAAELLVLHVHRELFHSVQADIGRQEGKEPTGETLRELVADRDWLFGEYSYHIDTTHLAATVRCAKILEDREALALAWDLTAYGRRLATQFQYKGEEPFVELYPSHAIYLQALLGREVTAAVDFFRSKAEGTSVEEHGSLAVETYVQLLDRLGRWREAVDALVAFGRSQNRVRQVAPLLQDLCGKLRDYSPLADLCLEEHDLLGYATALALSGSATGKT